MTNTILALDLGKFNSVHRTETARARRQHHRQRVAVERVKRKTDRDGRGVPRDRE